MSMFLFVLIEEVEVAPAPSLKGNPDDSEGFGTSACRPSSSHAAEYMSCRSISRMPCPRTAPVPFADLDMSLSPESRATLSRATLTDHYPRCTSLQPRNDVRILFEGDVLGRGRRRGTITGGGSPAAVRASVTCAGLYALSPSLSGEVVPAGGAGSIFYRCPAQWVASGGAPAPLRLPE